MISLFSTFIIYYVDGLPDVLPDLVPYDMGDDGEGLEQLPLEDLENTTIGEAIPEVKPNESGFDFDVFFSECINGVSSFS